MSSSSNNKTSGFPNVPPPQGSKAAASYARFIPREELGDFASWKPGNIGAAGGPGAAAGGASSEGPRPAGANARVQPQAAPPEPPEDLAARIATVRQAAYQEGYQNGYRDGTAALESFKQTFAAQATAQVGALLEGLDRQFQVLDGQVADTVMRCAIALARQVVRSELSTRPQCVAQVATEAVNAIMLSARHISVRVHPQDLPLVAEGAEEALAARGARLHADPALQRGDVRVESDVGSVDARLAQRWQQAMAGMGADTPWAGDDEVAPDPSTAFSTALSTAPATAPATAPSTAAAGSAAAAGER